MDENNVIDLSSFMLFEACGDSEADSGLNMAEVEAEADMDVADDDAQSCTCDLLDCGSIVELGEFDDPGKAHDEDLHVDDDDDDDDDGKEEVIDQDWTDDDDDDEVALSSTAKAGRHKKSRVCVDSTTGLMSEMEKNRLFWEACLAS